MDSHTILVRARNLIEQEGWKRGGIEADDPRHCALSAVGSAAGARSYEELACAVFCPRVAPNGTVVAEVGDLLDDMVGGPTWIWNDEFSRTKEEVLALFDRAIAKTAPEPDTSFLTQPEREHVEVAA